MMKWKTRRASATAWGVPLALVALTAPSSAQNLGMVTDWDATASVFIFDADTDTIVTELVLGGALDCEMLDNQTLGFVAGWTTGIWVIDLTTPTPTIVANVPTPNILAENLAITRDQRFLLICDGGGGNPPDPVEVMDISTLTLISTLDTGEDHNSITVCDNGSVLTTGVGSLSYSPHLRRMEIDGSGNLTDTGESLHFAVSRYAAFSPTCNYAVLHSTDGPSGGALEQMRSVTIPGLGIVDSRIAGGGVMSSVMHPAADLYYVRTNGGGGTGVEMWQYDHTSGQFVGTSPLATQPLGNIIYYWGIEQMRLHPDSSKLYVLDNDNDAVHILNAGTLAPMGTLPMPGSFTEPSGICFRTTSVPLAVDLEYFRARRDTGGNIVINWGTASELENAGFKLYRQAWSPAPSGLPTEGADLVNPSMIPARGTPFQATVYRWADRSAVAGQAYHYWLVDVDLHGETTTHGPISVR